MTRLGFNCSKLRIGCFSVARILAIASASSLFASFQPGPTPFVRASSGGNYLLVMTPQSPSEYGDARRWAKHYENFPVSGVYSNDGANRLLWPIQEYWFEETLVAFIELGDAIYTARSDWYDRPLVFQRWDQELRRYEPRYFLDRPWVRTSSTHPLEWLYSHHVEIDRMELRIETIRGGVFVFDLTTGAIVSSNREPPTVQKTGPLERDLVAKISQAIDIFAGKSDWKEAPKYIASSVLIECSDVRTRAEVAESVERIEKELGNRAAYLFQMFDVESAQLALRGVVRLEHDDSARFGVYRLPYGQAGDFLCGNPKLVEAPTEWRERMAYASISEIKVNTKKLEVAVALGLVEPEWRSDLPKDFGLVSIWMQDPDWRIVGMTAGRIRFPNHQDK